MNRNAHHTVGGLARRIELARRNKPFLMELEIISAHRPGRRIDGHYEPVMPSFVEITRPKIDLTAITRTLPPPVTIRLWVQRTERSQYVQEGECVVVEDNAKILPPAATENDHD